MNSNNMPKCKICGKETSAKFYLLRKYDVDEGVWWYFCSLECLKSFIECPILLNE